MYVNSGAILTLFCERILCIFRRKEACIFKFSFRVFFLVSKSRVVVYFKIVRTASRFSSFTSNGYKYLSLANFGVYSSSPYIWNLCCLLVSCFMLKVILLMLSYIAFLFPYLLFKLSCFYFGSQYLNGDRSLITNMNCRLFTNTSIIHSQLQCALACWDTIQSGHQWKTSDWEDSQSGFV